jgi:Domain of unknown function (DUF4926)
MINELDEVALAKPLPEHNLEAGDVGTVVMIHQGGQGYAVEFMTYAGATLAVVSVDADMIRPISAREIAHVREVA